MATSTDDNAADENLNKYRVWLIWRRCTSMMVNEEPLYEATERKGDKNEYR